MRWQTMCDVEGLEVEEEVMVCRLREQGDRSVAGKLVSLGDGEITIDSAADESCWPLDLCGAFEVKETKRNIILKAANGSCMRHEGEKDITFQDKESGELLGMTFQVTEVRKPLAAVRRLVEKGNVVQFGPEERHNYILNLQTRKKIKMHKKGGSYVLRVEYKKWIPGGDSVFPGPA